MKDLLEQLDVLKNFVEKLDENSENDGRTGFPYVIVRTYSAGVFAGELVERNGKEVLLKNARRLWHWAGAASLSQLAEEGTTKPDLCKFPCEVSKIFLTETIEILKVSKKAREIIKKVNVWKE